MSVLLINPKFPENVGNVLRSVVQFDHGYCYVAGDRWRRRLDKTRGPRPLRRYVSHLVAATPMTIDHLQNTQNMVAIELVDTYPPIWFTDLPDQCVFVLGPEDGTLDRSITTRCVRHCSIPGGCLNVSHAAAIAMYEHARQRAMR